jgi:glycosyltransferase involved in cell wall biosynthesis
LDIVTIVAANYLAYAEVLLGSVADHHPDARCAIVLVDLDDAAAVTTDHEILTLADLGLDADEVLHRRAIYDELELATSVKAAALSAVLARGATTAVYLDPDIVLYRPLAGLESICSAHEIVLTPHFLQPFPMDGRGVDELTILVSGMFNLGFVAVSPAAQPFLRFWDERLRRACVVDHWRGLFVDQRWVDQVPALFAHTVVRDSGWNVAYWNLHERPLSRSPDGTILAGSEPLTFFHFSGHDPLDGTLLSRYQAQPPRILLSEQPLAAELCRDWRERVVAQGFERPADPRRNGGVDFELTPSLRRLFGEACTRAESAGMSRPPHPVGPEGRRRFAEWCRGPSPWAPDDAGLPALLHLLWLSRLDLQRAFPQPLGAHAEALTVWGRDSPELRVELPAEVLPDDALVVGLRQARPVLASDPTPGLNVVGYFESILGLADSGRSIVLAAEAAGLPVATHAERRTNSAQNHRFRARDHRLLPFDTTVLAVNGERTAETLSDLGGDAARRSRRTIGFWYWEVDRLAEGMEAAFDLVDELWVASEYVEDIFREHTALPVRRFPLPVLWPSEPTRLLRDDLGLPEERFLFLFVFDFFSVVARKNPVGLIEAYRRAFGPDDGVGLVLKSVNGTFGLSQLAQLERLRLSVLDRPDIAVRDEYLDAGEMRALYELCDAYVSLHRAEGFGLTIANAMAAAKPVIATGFSGNLDFMDAGSALLVPYRLVEVGPGAGPYPADARWAEPDLDVASELMRALVDDQDAAAELGATARSHILERHSLRRAADFLSAEIIGATSEAA